MSVVSTSSSEFTVDPVVAWRLEALERAGYPPFAAQLLSREPEIDLHRAIRLLHDGCPVETALRILL